MTSGYVGTYAYDGPGPGFATSFNLLPQSNTVTYATATAVPWETDALSVIGSTILFVGGFWAKNKFAKPLQK
jgi:hypothetical protein